jgi:hypothetical protein
VIRPAAALAFLLAGCEPTLPTCPGTPQGAFLFTLTAAPATCGFKGPVDDLPTFVGVVSWLPDGGAALCVQRPLAAPKLGTRTGDAVSFSSEEPAVQLASCSCPLALVETVTGQLQRDGAGVAVRFEGEVVDALSLPSDPPCAAAPDVCTLVEAGTGAQPPCEFRYALSGK